MILVLGATGHVGSELVAQLAELGEPLRAMTRRPAQARLPRGAEAVFGDLDRPETLAVAMQGVRRVFLMSAQSHATSPFPTHDRLVARAAAEAGVERIVKLSVLGAGKAVHDVIASWHREAEEQVTKAGMEWTLLRPGRFMSNALQWAESVRRDGTVRAPFGRWRAAPIDPSDVAAVAARALTQPGHHGKIHSLSGPETLTPVQEVEILSEVLGRKLEFVPVPNDAARAGMLKSGMPPETVSAILARAEASDSSHEVLPTVEQVTGRAARTFRDWALAHREAFRVASE